MIAKWNRIRIYKLMENFIPKGIISFGLLVVTMTGILHKT